MHNKIVENDSFNHRDVDRLAVIMPVASSGIDSRWLKKQAMVLTNEINQIRPQPGHTCIHLVAMTAGEICGANKNADFFSRAAIKAKHPTFVSNSLVYKNHISHDRALASGSVLASAYNDPMERVELVISVDNDKWSKELNDLSNGQDLKFSMSCTLPYDVCMVCGNKAKHRREYCQCMKDMPGRILTDGRQVCVDNPNPDFYDISGVARPADAVAYILQKVASVQRVVTGSELYDVVQQSWKMGKQSSYQIQKLAAFNKLSEIEKLIEATAPADITGLGDTVEESDLQPEETEKLSQFAEHRLPELLSLFNKHQIVLPLKDFLDIIIKVRSAKNLDIKLQLPGIMQSCNQDDIVQDSKYDHEPLVTGGIPSDIQKIVEGMAGKVGMDDEALNSRKIHAVAVYKTAAIRAPLDYQRKEATRVERVPALEYASYLVAATRGMGDRAMKAAMVRNYVC